jgi:BirA family biotin operon repressor/biotin-[acetyl-CoA-carboxylase] ligase
LQLSPETSPIGNSFTELQSVDSTNNYALAKVHEGMAYHGDCFFAHDQTTGKGQQGKTWTTEASSNILLSIVLKPQFLEIYQQFQLSACVAVAAHQFFSKYAGDDTRIKWPNDLYWRNRKAGGILIENVVSSQQSPAADWRWAVVGIGININQSTFPGDLPNPVSLKQITGNHHDVIQLAKELCSSVGKFYSRLKNNGFETILDEYNEFLYKKNKVVKLKKDNRIFETMIKAVNDAGQLITQHGIEESFDFGQVEWLK